jgi:ADP-ribose pyrophosphatase
MKDQFQSPIPIPEIKSSEIVYKGYLDVRLDQLQLPHGAKMSYTSLKMGVNAAAILAKTADGKLIINKEYRHPTGKWLLSCPGGRIDPGESPLEAAKRELLEETGYGEGRFSLLGNAYPFPAVTDQIIYYIYVEDAVFVQPTHREPFELIHTELKTLEDLKREILAGFPVDGILCTALLLSQMHHGQFNF